MTKEGRGERVAGGEIEVRWGDAERMIALSDSIDGQYRQGWRKGGDEFGRDVMEVIGERGPIPIDKWMSHVLYGRDGYYSSGRARINRGDFSTVVGFPRDGLAITNMMFKELGPRRRVRVLSVASGNGDFDRYFGFLVGRDRKYGAVELVTMDYSPALLWARDRMRLSRVVSGSDYADYTMRIGQNGVMEVLREEKEHLLLSPKEVKQMTAMLGEIRLAGNGRSETDTSTTFLDRLRRFGWSSEKRGAAFEFMGAADLSSVVDFLVFAAEVDNDRTTRRLAGSAEAIPLPPNSVDVVFSNELIDAMPPKGYVVKSGEVWRTLVGLDSEGRFCLVYDRAAGADLELAKMRIKQMKQVGLVAQNGSVVTVNVGAVKYVKSCASVLRKGGVMITGDYTDRKETEGGVRYLDRFRAQRHRHVWEYVDDMIGDYLPPYLDVTVNMDPVFLRWAGESYGLRFGDDLAHVSVVEKYTTDREKRAYAYSNLDSKDFRVVIQKRPK